MTSFMEGRNSLNLARLRPHNRLFKVSLIGSCLFAVTGLIPHGLGIHAEANAQNYNSEREVVCARPEFTSAPDADFIRAKHAEFHNFFGRGSGIKIAVIDTGVADHPQLRGVIPGADLVTPSNPEPLLDCEGHGTIVAGIIAGTDLGIAPDSTIISIKQSSTTAGNPEESGNLKTMAAAIDKAVELGARIINISIISCVDPALNTDISALLRATEKAEAAGVIIVAAAGNISDSCPQGSKVFPAHIPTVIAVKALDENTKITSYSVDTPPEQFALSASGHIELGISPSGEGWAKGVIPPRQQHSVAINGTSFAAPYISAIVALMVERYPTASPADIKKVLQNIAFPPVNAINPEAAIAALSPEYAEITSSDKTPVRKLKLSTIPPTDPHPEERFRYFIFIFGALHLIGFIGYGIKTARK
ncbi:S8 family serine peptidase [Corynebacterium caspium]|uniref:S8 family serine peptidase n=1 Tax=Corynebacterium caspium TaxID=234828 RepID=UPI0003768A2E|nr:S8 family serine peptidase [Corynebacterium caspium]WKD59811.1 Subtilisin DY [Corynebacterium caspium DSM 44850]